MTHMVVGIHVNTDKSTLEWQVKRKNGFKKEGFETVMHVLGCIPL